MKSFYISDSSITDELVQDLEEIINNKAKTQIINYTYDENNTKGYARDYIYELRQEQKYQVEKIKVPKDIPDIMREVNDIEKEIKLIKKNMGFKMRAKVFTRSLGGYIRRIAYWMWRHKGASTGISITLPSAISGIISYFDLMTKLKHGVDTIKDMGNAVVKLGHDVKENLAVLNKYLEAPAATISWFFVILGSFLKFIHWISQFGLYTGISIFFFVIRILFKMSCLDR